MVTLAPVQDRPRPVACSAARCHRTEYATRAREPSGMQDHALHSRHQRGMHSACCYCTTHHCYLRSLPLCSSWYLLGALVGWPVVLSHPVVLSRLGLAFALSAIRTRALLSLRVRDLTSIVPPNPWVIGSIPLPYQITATLSTGLYFHAPTCSWWCCPLACAIHRPATQALGRPQAHGSRLCLARASQCRDANTFPTTRHPLRQRARRDTNVLPSNGR